MKPQWFLIPIAFIAISVMAQTIDSPPSGITIFSTSTLTNVYTASTVLDCQSYDSVSIVASTVTTQAMAVAKLKPQWSNDNSTWVDVNVLAAATISGYDQPYTLTSKQIVIQMTNAAPYGSYVELFPRNARYFRTLVQSTNVFTTGTLNITAQKLNNGGQR